jgi:hypothetical protein
MSQNKHQINFCSECGFHFNIPNVNFCCNCGKRQYQIIQQSQQQQSQPKIQTQQQQSQPKPQPKQIDSTMCTKCKKSPKFDNFSWCQPCYEKKVLPKQGEPSCTLCERRAYYNKASGEYSEVCTKHYNMNNE